MRRKVLIIDNSESVLHEISTLFEHSSEYTILTATTAETGYYSIVKHTPDIVLCDTSLPNDSGFELFELLKSKNDTKFIPFIFTCDISEDLQLSDYIEEGVNAIIPKPFESSVLLKTIDKFTNKNHKNLSLYQTNNLLSTASQNFTNSLPHEFRTPINQIVCSADYIMKHVELLEHEDIQELSNDVIASAKRLEGITDNYLKLSELLTISQSSDRVEELKNFMTIEPNIIFFDTATTIAAKNERIEDLIFEEEANGVGIQISSEKYYYIIHAIITNAFKFSEKGTKVKMASWLDNGNFYFSIKDKGRGMTLDQIESIGLMKQFERDQYEQQGLGLGLYLARTLAELHEGDLKIESIRGEGTNVTGRLIIKDTGEDDDDD